MWYTRDAIIGLLFQYHNLNINILSCFRVHKTYNQIIRFTNSKAFKIVLAKFITESILRSTSSTAVIVEWYLLLPSFSNNEPCNFILANLVT